MHYAMKNKATLAMSLEKATFDPMHYATKKPVTLSPRL